MQAVEQFYERKGAEKGSYLAIEFDAPSDAISLYIPMPIEVLSKMDGRFTH